MLIRRLSGDKSKGPTETIANGRTLSFEISRKEGKRDAADSAGARKEVFGLQETGEDAFRSNVLKQHKNLAIS